VQGTHLFGCDGWLGFLSSDRFSSAMTILQGMVGMNGVSLPASLEGKLGQIIGAQPWLVFSGLVPSALSMHLDF